MTTCFPHDFPCPFTIPPEDPKPWPPMSACSFSFFVFVNSHASFLSFTSSPGLLSADIRGLGGWGNVKARGGKKEGSRAPNRHGRGR